MKSTLFDQEKNNQLFFLKGVSLSTSLTYLEYELQPPLQRRFSVFLVINFKIMKGRFI